jgi:anti-anti-sigma factor
MTAPLPKFAAAAGKLGRTTWCIYAAGELDMASAPRLGRHLATAAQRSDVDLVIVELTDIRFIDANGLGTLIQARQDLEGVGMALRLTGARGQVAELLYLSGLVDELGVELADPGSPIPSRDARNPA